MRRHITTSIVSVTVLAVVLFAVPLAVAVQHLYRRDAIVSLVRAATQASTALPSPPASTGDPVELPSGTGDARVGLYDANGRRVNGDGPAAADAAVRQALAGRLVQTNEHRGPVVALPVSANEQVVAVVRATMAASVVDNRVHRAWLVMAMLGLGAVIVAGVAALFQGRRLAQPLSALAGIATQLGNGDFSAHAAPLGTTEVRAVGAALNATADRLANLVARERAFSADASHQLRTPLAGLRLRLEAAQLDPHADRAQMIDGALEEIDRLEATVDDLLNLARGSTAVNEPATIDALIDDAQTTWHGSLASKGRPLRVIVEPGLPGVQMAPAATRQILNVLLDNASIHGRGAVTLAAGRTAGGLVIEVSDEGTGPGGDQDRIFERGASGAGGSGIGLALARSLAEAEGGRLLLADVDGKPVFRLIVPSAKRSPDVGDRIRSL